VSTITTAAADQQERLVDAAIVAGVKRLLPSEFGVHLESEANRGNPVFQGKTAMRRYIEKKLKKSDTSYTFLENGLFLDWGLATGFIADLKKRTFIQHDGGDVEFSSTTLDGVGQAVVGILRSPAETANRIVKVHSAITTKRKLLELAKNALGEDGWTSLGKDTKELEQEAYQILDKDPANVMGWVTGFLWRAGFGRDCASKFQDNDNDLLGVPQLDDADIKAIIVAAADR